MRIKWWPFLLRLEDHIPHNAAVGFGIKLNAQPPRELGAVEWCAFAQDGTPEVARNRLPMTGDYSAEDSL